ncbi:MAG: hypothetical protein BroJett024_19500 [Alphaproteobacteria bacterium]|nr:MAG: hypothetical protein BroJett024_19500 [Alphaproteobacteria bacterium]
MGYVRARPPPRRHPSLETLVTIDFLYQSARTVVLALTVTICAVFAALVVADDVEDLISKRLINIRFDVAAQLANPQVWDFAARSISKLVQVNPDFAPDQRAQVISNLAALGERWHPYFAAITGDQRSCGAATSAPAVTGQ